MKEYKKIISVFGLMLITAVVIISLTNCSTNKPVREFITYSSEEYRRNKALIALKRAIKSTHCLQACPKMIYKDNKIVSREIYILSNNFKTKFADWVAYVVSIKTIGPSKKRRWKADPALKEKNTLEPGDYKGAHKALKTDRGYQAPLASLAGTPHWRETNYLSNIGPRKSALNQGSWVKLETKVRKLTNKFKKVYVVTGPLYLKKMPSLPGADEVHVVPSHYFKIIRGNRFQHAAFIFPQTAARKDHYCKYLSTIKRIQLVGNIQFPQYGSKNNLLCN